MAYCTQEELVNARLNTLVMASFEADQPGCIDAAIENASAIMDTFLNSRYATPVTDAGALPSLRACCVALSRYEIMSRRGLAENNPDVCRDYDYKMEWLKGVAKGTYILPITGGGDSASPRFTIRAERFGTTEDTNLPYFGSDKLSGF